MKIDVQWYERVPDWAWVVGGIVGGVAIIIGIFALACFLSDL
jgi:hypothetical protein